jgi:hypothetical protein
MSLTKLFLGGNNDVIYELFPPKESLVSDITDGDRKIEKAFFTVYSINCLFARGWGRGVMTA